MALAPAPCYISPASYYSPPIAPIHYYRPPIPPYYDPSKEKKMKKCRRRRSRRNEKNSPNTIAEVETRETEEPEPALGLFYRICSSLGLFHRISSPKEKFEEEMKKQPAPRRRHSNERNRTKMSGCETSAEEEAGETEEQEPDLGLFHRISSHLIRWLIPFPTKEKFEEEMKKQPAPRRRHSNERNRTKMSGCETSSEEETGETEEPEPAKEKCEEEMKKQPVPRRRHSNERNRTKMSGCETSAEEEAGETEEQEPDLGLFHRISSHLIRWLIPFPNYSPPISPFPIPSKEKFEEEMKKQPAPRRRHSNERNRTKMSGCEASAEEEAGETEEPEPVNEVAVYSLQAPEPRNRVFKIFLSPHTGPQHSA